LNNLLINDIKNFIVCLGPGSFTGIRVTTTFIKTIGVIDESITVEVIDSIEMLKKSDGDISIVDARNGNWFVKKNDDILIENNIKITNETKRDYSKISKKNIEYNIKNFKKIDDINKIEPLYIKGIVS